MKTYTFEHRGTQINKIAFSEIEYILEEKGLNADTAFNLMADENEFIYVSNGFVSGLKKDNNENGEWHHFFIKDGNSFNAGKFNFN